MGLLTGCGQIPGAEDELEWRPGPGRPASSLDSAEPCCPLTRALDLGQQTPEAGIPSLHALEVKSRAGCSGGEQPFGEPSK